jgi:pimeloyl-ACP methyl ester carboxylesterase
MPFAEVTGPTSQEGARLHYLEAGSGDQVLVLLHAFPLHAGMWERQLEELSDGWRVVAPDLPGFGQSDPLPEPDQASLEAMADAVAGLLSHLEVPAAVIGGLSMGGYAAFVLARHHRRLVRGLVLADTRAAADTQEVKERRTNQQAQVREQGTEELVEGQLQALLTEETHAERPEIVEHARRLMSDASPAAVVAALEAMKRRSDATGDLAGLDVPTLVVVGEQDGSSPVDVAEEMAQRLPHARLAVIPGAGHLSNLEQPEVFNAELKAFLGELGS